MSDNSTDLLWRKGDTIVSSPSFMRVAGCYILTRVVPRYHPCSTRRLEHVQKSSLLEMLCPTDWCANGDSNQPIDPS